MNKKYFKPTLGKDNNWYLRVVQSDEGEFGELKETSGFLKFADETKATAAFEALESGEATASTGREIGTTGLYHVSIAKVKIEEETEVK